MKKYIKKLLFTATLVLGLSVMASAQSSGDKKKVPPKKPPPVIKPKKPKKPKPKPTYAVIIQAKIENDFA